jgi:hypothetical protein
MFGITLKFSLSMYECCPWLLANNEGQFLERSLYVRYIVAFSEARRGGVQRTALTSCSNLRSVL